MLVLFSLTAPIVIGLAALGTEGGYLYMRKTETQTAADMAALSAANALMSGNTGGVKLEAQAVAAASGYVNGQNGVTVAVNSPPSTGTRTSDNSAVEVIVTANVQPMLSKIAHPSDYKVVGRTVAAAGMAAGCALALNPAASWGISVGGTAAVDMSKCAIYSNSTTTSTFTSNGGGTLKAAVLAGSGAAIAGSGFTSGSTLLSQPAQSNPYANLTAPVTNFSAYAGGKGCPNKEPANVNVYWELYPGTYCGLSVGANVTVKLHGGTYYIVDNDLKFGSSWISLYGDGGVTFVLVSSTGKTYPAATFGAGGIIDISAPTSGPFAGVVLYSNAPATANASFSLGGGAKQYLGGAVVNPNQMISFGGSGASSSGHSCTQLIGAQISFSGVSSLDNDCAGYGTRSIGGGATAIVE
jgi:hypothetical protein